MNVLMVHIRGRRVNDMQDGQIGKDLEPYLFSPENLFVHSKP